MSAIAAATSEKKSIHVVQLDGLVLLKIIKHCKESTTIVTGQLLGLDIDGRLEITHSFPLPSPEGEESSEVQTAQYQLSMMRQLREVNVDANTVGWYQSAFMGGFMTQAVLDAQYSHQKEIPNSVVVVYDPYRTSRGHLHLKAYRLTDAFMAAYAGGKSTAKLSKYDFTSSDIMAEVPIKVHNSHLVHGFLYELREEKTMSCEFDRLHVEPAPYLEKTIGILSGCIDEYAGEQSKLQFYQRQLARQRMGQEQHLKKREVEAEARSRAGKESLPEEDLTKNPLWKPIPKPSRLETFLLSNQISHYCREVATTSTQACNKLYVTEALQKSATTPAVAPVADRKDGGKSK